MIKEIIISFSSFQINNIKYIITSWAISVHINVHQRPEAALPRNSLKSWRAASLSWLCLRVKLFTDDHDHVHRLWFTMGFWGLIGHHTVQTSLHASKILIRSGRTPCEWRSTQSWYNFGGFCWAPVGVSLWTPDFHSRIWGHKLMMIRLKHSFLCQWLPFDGNLLPLNPLRSYREID